MSHVFFQAEDGIRFFFFQAEDGIRDLTVTGVQTCALPISRRLPACSSPASGEAGRGPGTTRSPTGSTRCCACSAPASRSNKSRPNSGDRKSTRLNSSHSQISYAVFCLKKKKKKKTE